jgi:hypothetical protein
MRGFPTVSRRSRPVSFFVRRVEGAAMGEVGMNYLFSQLGYHAPALLVYLIAFILALVFVGRAKMPCLLTFVGVGVLVATTLGVAVYQASLLDAIHTEGRDHAEFARRMPIVGVVGSCARAVGLGFLVAAIFVGRRSAARGRAEPPAAPDPAT